MTTKKKYQVWTLQNNIKKEFLEFYNKKEAEEYLCNLKNKFNNAEMRIIEVEIYKEWK